MGRRLTLGVVSRKRGKRLVGRKSTNGLGRSTKPLGIGAWGQLFASRTLVALLKVFLLNPENAFYQRELVAAAAARLYAVQQELGRLERLGLIVKTPRGNRAYYKADRSHPVFEDLKRVIVKTVGLGDALRDALTGHNGSVRVAFIYGSYARGQEKPGSDIDLLLIGSLTPRDAAAVLGPVGRELGREFNSVVYSPDEFRRKVQAGHHFLTEVLRGPKMYLIGSQDELASFAGSRASASA